MKQIKQIVTETYEVRDGFRVDVVLYDPNGPEGVWEAYLYQTGFGIKELMFGVMKQHVDKRVFVKMIEANVEDYIKSYEEEYMY